MGASAAVFTLSLITGCREAPLLFAASTPLAAACSAIMKKVACHALLLAKTPSLKRGTCADAGKGGIKGAGERR